MIAPPVQLIVGPPRHGVVQYAASIADALALRDPHARVIRADSAEMLPKPEGAAHIHFTDRLFGTTAHAAADAFELIAGLARVSVTLHDLPQPSDGDAAMPRRLDAYRRVVVAASAIAVNSTHEAQLIEQYLDAGAARIDVIHLPVAARAVPPISFDTDGSIAVLGFIYPGKGHAEVIRAAAQLDAPVVALGAPSPGHDGDVEALLALADDLAVPFEVTGYLAHEDLVARCRAAAVPIVALQHVSASGSTTTWIESGRRPLVPDSRYAREISALRPGSVTLYDPARLRFAITAALDHPESTWMDSAAETRPHLDDTVDAYLRWWGEVHS